MQPSTKKLLHLLMHMLNSVAYVCAGGRRRRGEDFFFNPIFCFIFSPQSFLLPCFSLRLSVLSPAYHGDLIARGPGRILGRFWRREASGTGCGRLVANIHTHTKIFSPTGIDTCFHTLLFCLFFIQIV